MPIVTVLGRYKNTTWSTCTLIGCRVAAEARVGGPSRRDLGSASTPASHRDLLVYHRLTTKYWTSQSLEHIEHTLSRSIRDQDLEALDVNWISKLSHPPHRYCTSGMIASMGQDSQQITCMPCHLPAPAAVIRTYGSRSLC